MLFPKQGILGVFVDHRLILNAFSPVSLSEGRDCFILVLVSWRDRSYHDSLGVPTETVLQEPSEFAIPVGDVSALAISKGTDDIPERTQTQVDFLGFIQAVTTGLGFGLPLTARQVDQVQLADLETLLPLNYFLRFNLDYKNTM